MGLDAVELVMEVEETFGFSIPDEDVADLATVGKLFDYILEYRFAGRQAGVCLSSVAFYKVRGALVSVCKVNRRDVRPTSGLANIMPVHRRRLWADLHEVLGMRLPELVRPTWVTAMATVIGGALVVAAMATVITRAGASIPVAIFFASALIGLIAFLFFQATKPLAVMFGPEFATVGGLAETVLQKNYGVISDECQRANAEEIWKTLRKLIAEQLGVPLDAVTREANFVKDLGVG
jgi:acyl carrier protein